MLMFALRISPSLGRPWTRKALDASWRFPRAARRIPVRFACTASSRNLSSSTRHKADTKKEQHGMLADLENSVLKRLEQAGFRRSRRFYWTITAAAVVLVFGIGYLYLFPHKIRQQVVEEVSTVASQSLEDEKIVNRAEQLSKDVVNGILSDDQMKAIASDFVKDIIISEPIKDAAVGTILGLLNDDEVLSMLRQRLSEIILNILQQETTRQIVMSQINSILINESVRAALQNLLQELMNTPELKTMMADFFKDVLASDTVRDQGKLLGQQVTTDVITSKEIQEQAGNAIWSALKFSVTPNALRGKNDTETVPTQGDLEAAGSKDLLTERRRILEEDISPLYYDSKYHIDDDNIES